MSSRKDDPPPVKKQRKKKNKKKSNGEEEKKRIVPSELKKLIRKQHKTLRVKRKVIKDQGKNLSQVLHWVKEIRQNQEKWMKTRPAPAAEDPWEHMLQRWKKIERGLRSNRVFLHQMEVAQRNYLIQCEDELGDIVIQTRRECERFDSIIRDKLQYQLAAKPPTFLPDGTILEGEKIQPEEGPLFFPRSSLFGSRLHDQSAEESERKKELPKTLKKDPTMMSPYLITNVFRLHTISPYGDVERMLRRRVPRRGNSTAKKSTGPRKKRGEAKKASATPSTVMIPEKL